MSGTADDVMKAALQNLGSENTFPTEGKLGEVRAYWNTRIHDLSITTQPLGTKAFFDELEDYRFDKLEYLPRIVNFADYRGLQLLEVGCGVGTDLVRFAKGGALVTGIDLAEQSVGLCRQNLAANGVSGAIQVMNGEQMIYADNTFDIVYAHGVLQYTPDPNAMIGEIHRVLKPDGHAIVMVYNRYSWLSFMSRLSHVDLEHDDAPVFAMFSRHEFEKLLQSFRSFKITPERFPVASRLHQGWKAVVYNQLFVPAFNLVPRPFIRSLGWHLMAKAIK
jgi:ubiquinone/menaquinone biosynthesis C-methylase UbiE